jgi:hypothetical protein
MTPPRRHGGYEPAAPRAYLSGEACMADIDSAFHIEPKRLGIQLN